MRRTIKRKVNKNELPSDLSVDLKEKLRLGELTIGSWITLAHPAIPEIMAKAGFDWLTVDLEHSVITIREAEELIRVISLCGVAPLVRLSANDYVQIKRVMDAGAHGVIVPMVNSAEDAQKAVEAVCYPPDGKRGVGLARAQGYGNNFEKYKDWVNRKSIVIVQIEHVMAVENLDAILKVEGVDGFIVGPYDLSASLGVPGQFENRLMCDAMDRIKSFIKPKSKVAGIHVVEPDIVQLQKRIEEGYRFLAYSLDIRMLDTCCRSALTQIRG
jgi:2-keto-3-deoxy-L-rhamnonate aldolase RhmA